MTTTRRAGLPAWVRTADALVIHERQIREFGGAAGIRDMGLLESALARPINAHVYGETDPHALAALYAAGIIRNHPFVDGNKRTGYVVCLAWLRLAGWTVVADEPNRLAITLELAGGLIGPEAFADWLRDNTRAL